MKAIQKHFLWSYLLFLILVLPACDRILPNPDATATPIPPVQPEGTVQADLTQTATPDLQTVPVNPTPTVNFTEPNPVQITELQFFTQDYQLVVVAKFQNIYEEAILRDVQFEIVALDSIGNRIAEEIGSIEYLFPKETSGLVRTLNLQTGIAPANVQVHFSGGIPDRKLKYQQPFSISQPAYFADEEQGTVITGWLENRDAFTYTEVNLNAVAYNVNGEIIGGGSTYTEFVPEKDRIGVTIPSLVSQEAARVEIYPWISAYSASLEGGRWWNNIKVRNWNFVINADRQISGGAELTNITDRVLTGNYYILTVYDAQGRVCLVDKDFINFFLPGETQYFSPGILSAPTGSEPAKVDLIVIPGEFGEYDLAYNPLTTSQEVLVADANTLVVRLSVLNNLNASISKALVTTILMDEKGNIVGGGQETIFDLLPNSTTSIEVPVLIVGDYTSLTIKSSATLPPAATIGP